MDGSLLQCRIDLVIRINIRILFYIYMCAQRCWVQHSEIVSSSAFQRPSLKCRRRTLTCHQHGARPVSPHTCCRSRRHTDSRTHRHRRVCTCEGDQGQQSTGQTWSLAYSEIGTPRNLFLLPASRHHDARFNRNP